VSKDRDKIDEVWQDSFKVWFPDGKEDTSIELIQLVSEEGEYWDRTGVQKLKYLFEAGKAYVSGDQPEVGEDVNARVNL
jgi:general stress protein 26